MALRVSCLTVESADPGRLADQRLVSPHRTVNTLQDLTLGRRDDDVTSRLKALPQNLDRGESGRQRLKNIQSPGRNNVRDYIRLMSS